MESFITLDMFLSFGGCCAMVSGLTQVAKKIATSNEAKEVKYNAKLWAFLFSAIITAIRIIIIADYSLIGVLVGAMNIVPIFLGSIGVYESLLKPVGTLFNKDTKEEVKEQVQVKEE